ncbi:uncharacterized protein LOC107140643 [Marmota marmota marmota]|uniref:uncharacterized protein LOC107140643 n=1 Tax=Marmota marmota marmota TaxID=9994 RepID=UPI0020929CC4|nr:uncharacterized protein LOC107140643 [Marmota marmota marmota]
MIGGKTVDLTALDVIYVAGRDCYTEQSELAVSWIMEVICWDPWKALDGGEAYLVQLNKPGKSKTNMASQRPLSLGQVPGLQHGSDPRDKYSESTLQYVLIRHRLGGGLWWGWETRSLGLVTSGLHVPLSSSCLCPVQITTFFSLDVCSCLLTVLLASVLSLFSKIERSENKNHEEEEEKKNPMPPFLCSKMTQNTIRDPKAL